MCLFKRKEPNFRSDCWANVMYMCSVINSCVTGEQLEAAWTWTYNTLKSWEYKDEEAALKQDLAYEWVRAIHDRYDIYYSYMYNALTSTIEKINKKNAQDKEHKA